MTAATHGRSGRPWRRLREQVLEEEPYCQIRGPKCTRISTTADHIVPLSVAPELAHDRSNLRGACKPCNYAGGARMTNAARPPGYRPPYKPPRPSSTYRPPEKACACSGYCLARDAGRPLPVDCYGITARRL